MVKIITDTLSCLPKTYGQQHDVPIIPQVVYFGNESFLEGVTMDAPAFLARLTSSKLLPKTAAPPPELFYKEFERLTPLNEPILCIHPSSQVSGTVRSALTAKEDFAAADIRVIDTLLIGSALGSLVQLAVEWAEAGESADVIEKQVRELAGRCRIYFLVATMEYLARGGRIGGAQALLGSILQIKPLLTFSNGRVNQFEKERTHKRALMRLKELTLNQIPRDRPGYLTVMHAGVPQEGAELAEALRAELGLKEVAVYDLPPAIVTHAGPGALVVAFFT